MEELRFDLKNPVEFSLNGELAKGEFILCKGPTFKESKQCSILKQAFFRALPDIDSNTDVPEKTDDSPVDIKGTDVIVLLSRSKEVDLGMVLDVAKKLLTSGVAMMEGEVKLTSYVIDKMTYYDFERLVGEYMANFILESSLLGIEEKSSKA